MTYMLYILAALYLGLLTSISPCPLATNIAAISYVGRKVGSTRLVVNAGLLYTLGRCLLYLALAALLTTTALSIPVVSIFLQKYMHLVLGPIFLVLGMFLVGLITVSSGGTMMSEGMQKRVDAMGVWGPAIGRFLRSVVLSHIGSLVLRPGGLDHGLRSRGDYGRPGESRHRPAASGTAGRVARTAAGIRHRDGRSGVDRGVPAGLQREVGRQDLQRAVQGRVVGADRDG